MLKICKVANVGIGAAAIVSAQRARDFIKYIELREDLYG